MRAHLGLDQHHLAHDLAEAYQTTWANNDIDLDDDDPVLTELATARTHQPTTR